MCRKRRELTFGMVILLVIATGTVSFAQGKITLRSDAERALQSICRQIQGRYKWLITFEEPPFENPVDLEDKAKPGTGGTALVPRGNSFTFDLDEPLAPRSGERPVPDRAVLDRLLRTYRRSANWPFYGVRADGQYSHVTPSALRDVKGEIKAFVPMLDTRVSFPAAKRTLYDAVQLVLSKVSERRGIPIVQGIYPNNFFHQREVWLGAANEPVREVLITLFGNAGVAKMLVAMENYTNSPVNYSPIGQNCDAATSYLLGQGALSGHFSSPPQAWGWGTPLRN